MNRHLSNIARAFHSVPLKVHAAAVSLTVGAMSTAHATQANQAVSNFKELMSTGVGALIAAGAAAGVASIIYGGLNLKKKGGDRGEDVTVGKIIFPIAGGGVLLAIAFVAAMTVDLAGGTSSNIGQGITVGQ